MHTEARGFSPRTSWLHINTLLRCAYTPPSSQTIRVRLRTYNQRLLNMIDILLQKLYPTEKCGSLHTEGTDFLDSFMPLQMESSMRRPTMSFSFWKGHFIRAKVSAHISSNPAFGRIVPAPACRPSDCILVLAVRSRSCRGLHPRETSLIIRLVQLSLIGGLIGCAWP